MHPAISYELTKARIADLRHQAQRDAPPRAADCNVPRISSHPCHTAEKRQKQRRRTLNYLSSDRNKGPLAIQGQP